MNAKPNRNRYVQVTRNTAFEITPEIEAYVRRQKRRRWIRLGFAALVIAALVFPVLRLLARVLLSW